MPAVVLDNWQARTSANMRILVLRSQRLPIAACLLPLLSLVLFALAVWTSASCTGTRHLAMRSFESFSDIFLAARRRRHVISRRRASRARRCAASGNGLRATASDGQQRLDDLLQPLGSRRPHLCRTDGQRVAPRRPAGTPNHGPRRAAPHARSADEPTGHGACCRAAAMHKSAAGATATDRYHTVAAGARQIRVLRLQLGAQRVDGREAYIDQVWPVVPTVAPARRIC